jgi:predicted Zn-dependent peptidase
MRDQQFPVLFKGSRYADRLTIGKKEILEKATPDTIRRFYRDWYRPNLMAVIAVGDFDVDAMEKAIRTQFSPLTNPPHQRPRTLYPVPDHARRWCPSLPTPRRRQRAWWSTTRKSAKRSAVRDYRRHLASAFLQHGR